MPPFAGGIATIAALTSSNTTDGFRQLMGGGAPPGPPPVPGPTCTELGLPCGLTQGVVCDANPSDVRWFEDDDWRYVESNSIPAFPVLDYCPFGIGALYCGEYKSCPSGNWGNDGDACVPPGSGIILDPNRPGADWGTIATSTDDCPQESWKTMTCEWPLSPTV